MALWGRRGKGKSGLIFEWPKQRIRHKYKISTPQTGEMSEFSRDYATPRKAFLISGDIDAFTAAPGVALTAIVTVLRRERGEEECLKFVGCNWARVATYTPLY